VQLGLACFGSPTTSNQTISPFPTLKIGPGDSARSHTADEYIAISEIEQGAALFIKLLDNLQL
jgi:acetylornithine deacetylase